MRRSRLLAGLLSVAALAIAAFAVPASADEGDFGGTTTVTLNPDVLPTLGALNTNLIAPGFSPAAGQIAFPITGIENGVVGHKGGLSFTPLGGGSLAITKFNVDTNTGFLNARAVLNGKKLRGRVPIFQLGAPQPINGSIPDCAGIPAGLSLTPEAAGALGAPGAAGTFIGDACVVPVPEGQDED